MLPDQESDRKTNEAAGEAADRRPEPAAAVKLRDVEQPERSMSGFGEAERFVETVGRL